MAITDPRKTRDFGPVPDRADYDADEDPLVELARIVSEDGGFSGRGNRMRAEPAKSPATPKVDASDLEAELLEELETSFPAPLQAKAPAEPPKAPQTRAPVAPAEPREQPAPPVREAMAAQPTAATAAPAQNSATPHPAGARRPDVPKQPAPARQQPVSAPAAIEPARVPPEQPARRRAPEQPVRQATAAVPPSADDPDDLLRSIEEQLSQFERRVRSEGFSAADEQLATDDAQWSWEKDDAFEPAPDTGTREEISPAPTNDYRFRGPAAARPARREPVELESEDAEAFGRPASPFAKSRGAHSRDPEGSAGFGDGRLAVGDEIRGGLDDFSDEPAQPDDRSDSGLSGLEAELNRELDTAYRSPQQGSRQREAPMQGDDMRAVSDEDRGQDDFSDLGSATVIAPEHGMRPPPRPRGAPRRRSRKGLVSAAAVIVVVLIGGAAAMYVRSLEQAPSGPPPVIAASEGPMKVEPTQEQADAGQETVGSTVYDRVAGRAPETEENIVEGAEEPREIARIVLPQTQGESDALVRPVGGEDASVADAELETGDGETQGDADFGPRRVPTYVVRPDGTIVETEATGDAAETASADLSSQQMVAEQTEAMEPTPVQTVRIDEPRTAGAAPLGSSAEAGAPETASAPAPEQSVQPPAVTEAPSAETAPATEIAALQSEEPTPSVDTTTGEGQELASAEPAAPPPDASGYVVQLSAQTSEAGAQSTFAGLKQQFPTVLGDLEPNIQRADLGAKGIYYRVRVGPWTERADAVQICEALKSAGGDCYVTQ
jgi:hypothetical protein